MADIRVGDCRTLLAAMEPQSVQCCVTSPPYFGLRDYGMDRQIGLEQTPDEYVAEMVSVFREVRRVLRDDGTLWLNLGDSYSTDAKWGGSTGGKAAKALHGKDGGGRNKTRTGLPDKNLLGIPWRVAFALQADGWYLRQDIIWHKPNPMPESVKDRCTKAHEYIFMLSKSARYFFDADAIKEPSVWKRENNPDWNKQRAETNAKKGAGNRNAADGGFTGWSTEQGRNKRSVWTVTTKPFKGAHFATFSPDLIEPCILAGSAAGGTVLDPFFGAGTTGLVAKKHGRECIGMELNPAYAEIAKVRLGQATEVERIRVGLPADVRGLL